MRVFRKIVSAAAALSVAFCLSANGQSQGSWPIKSLELTGPANGGSQNFTNLNTVVATNVTANNIVSSNLTAGTINATNLLSSNTYTKVQVDLMNSNLNASVVAETNRAITAEAAYSNLLKSTTLNNEGMRLVGTLGGYTLDEFFEDNMLKGMARDLPDFTYVMSPATNLNVSWTMGDVYSPVDGYFHLNLGSQLLTDNVVNYGYWTVSNPNQVSWTTGSRPNITNDVIPMITFVCAFGRIIHAGETIPIGDMVLRMDNAHYQVMPSLVSYGLNYASTGTNFNQIIQNAGEEMHNMNEPNPHPAKDLTVFNTNSGSFLITYFHTNNSSWGLAITNQLPIDQYDNGTNLVSCVLSNWYRGLFVSAANSPSMGWVYPVGYYTNYADALAADDPTMPSGFDPYIPRCTAYIFQGGDTNLRTSADSWLDRRFMIRRGSISTGGGGSSSTTPTLYQVLLQGKSTGGILPDGAGMPSDPDQLANKQYVDSTINNINAGTAYVDSKDGNDATALLQDSTKTYKTIQAAINAAAVVASDTNRFVVRVSVGAYNESLTMKNFIGVAGGDTESTVVNGTVTFPPAFTDVTGAEMQLITVSSTNTAALVVNSGADLAYSGIRSCYVKALYDNDATYKSVVLMQKGLCEVYGTTYFELNLNPTGGSGTSRDAQIYEHTTDLANPGRAQMFSYSSSCTINSLDENDDISMLFTHGNTDSNDLNTIQSGIARIYLNSPGLNYSNQVKLIHNKTAMGNTRCKDKIVYLFLVTNNFCDVMCAYNSASVAPGSTVVYKDGGISIVTGDNSNIWWGAATGPNDSIKVLNTTIFSSVNNYPQIYTNKGSLGNYAIDAPAGNGDHLFGGAIDMSSVNTAIPSAPSAGHMKIYADTTSGLENPYFLDSTTNKIRFTRDSMATYYNDDSTTLQVGEAVYISSGISGTAQKVKRAKADSLSTLPAVGIVANPGGIPVGGKGRIMKIGRTELFMDTSMWTPGQKLYVSSTVAGGITNVEPSGAAISQLIGWCNVSGTTNGLVSVQTYKPDTLGNLLPKDYALSANTSNWDMAYSWVNGNSNGVSYVFLRSNAWDVATSWVSLSSNAVQSGTGNWNRAYAWVSGNSNNATYAFGRTSVWDGAYAWVNGNSNNAAYVFGRTSTWDIASSWVSINSNAVQNGTGNWNTAYTWVNANSNALVSATFVPSKFKASLGPTNIVTPTGAKKIPTTNLLYITSSMGSYSNSLSRWYPRQTNVIVRISGANDYASMANSDVLQMTLYKNGTNYSDVWVATVRSGDSGAHWEFVDTVTTSTNDYYEVYSTSTLGGSRTTIRAGTNNWWFGETSLK